MLSRSQSSKLRQRERSLPPPYWKLWLAAFFLLGVSAFFIFDFLFPAVVHSSAGKAVETPPWGELEYATLKLELPDELFDDVSPQPIQWVFENFSQEQLEALIANTDLTAKEKNLLLDKARWKAMPNGWQIAPPLEVVRDMSRSARKTLYRVLGESSQNSYIQNPCRFNLATFDEWLAECGLPEEKQQVFRRLTFYEGDSAYFYDGRLMEWISTPDERRSLARAVRQTRALLMKLRITPQTDVEALLRYWGQGGRGEAMWAFLESLDDVPGGISVSVSYFFPAFARMRLYTFPDNERLSYRQDCIWTTMNFFNETPDYSISNHAQLLAKLQSDYTEIMTNWTFGDVMALVNSQQIVEHMCVYIADDVVFTKNGGTPTAPWVLMKRSEMLKAYPSEKPLKLRVYRKKGTTV